MDNLNGCVNQNKKSENLVKHVISTWFHNFRVKWMLEAKTKLNNLITVYYLICIFTKADIK